MANRVDSEAVKKVVDTDLTDLAPYIDMAHAVVEEHLLSAGMSDALLTMIETQLSGHFLTIIREREVISEKIGDSQVAYGDSVGKGYMATRYGRVACTLDTSGILSTLTGVKQNVESI